jgi:carbon storage regulator
MLLMTRRVGEALMINGEIELKILEVRGNRVKIGCEFPAGNTVFRQELFEKIQTENKAASLAHGPATAGTPLALTGVLAGVLRGATLPKSQNNAQEATKADPNDQPKPQPTKPQR